MKEPSIKSDLADKLPQDPDSIAQGDRDSEMKSIEATQAHNFRESAFTIAFIFCLILGILWAIMMFSFWPDPKAEASVVVLYAVKCSLVTITFLTILVSTMRFAIRCYGHHNSKDDKEQLFPTVIEFFKTLTAFCKGSSGTGS